MDFSVRLKKLLDAGNLKMKDLGSYLNYDLSYISKWVNGKCLPSTKTAEETLERMAKFFATKLYQTDGQKTVVEITGRDVSIDRLPRLEMFVLSILTDGYYYSLSKEEEVEFDSESRRRLNGRKDEIVGDVSRELKKYIAKSEENIEIYFAIGKVKFFTELLKEFNTFLWAKKHSVKLKFVVNPDTYNNIVDNGPAILHALINTIIFLNMELSVAEVPSEAGYIYVKNRGFFDLRLNGAGEAISMVHSENDDLFREYDDLIQNQAYGERIIMKSREENGMDEDYNEYLITNKPEKFLVYVSFFDGLASNELVDKLIKENKIVGLEKYIIERNTNELSPLLNMKAGSINISKKGIFEAIRDGELSIGEFKFKLKEKDMDDYVNNIVKIFSNVDGTDFNFINDDICPMNIYENNINIFSTVDYLIIKKNPKYTDSKVRGYFEVIDKRLTEVLFNTMENHQSSGYLEEAFKTVE